MAEKTRRVIVEHRSGGGAMASMPMKSKPSANIDFPDGTTLPAIHVGKKVTVTLTGRIKSVRASDQYGPANISMEVNSCECDHGIEGDLEEAKESRTADKAEKGLQLD
jgi:hypothetical protein